MVTAVRGGRADFVSGGLRLLRDPGARLVRPGGHGQRVGRAVQGQLPQGGRVPAPLALADLRRRFHRAQVHRGRESGQRADYDPPQRGGGSRRRVAGRYLRSPGGRPRAAGIDLRGHGCHVQYRNIWLVKKDSVPIGAGAAPRRTFATSRKKHVPHAPSRSRIRVSGFGDVPAAPGLEIARFRSRNRGPFADT